MKKLGVIFCFICAFILGWFIMDGIRYVAETGRPSVKAVENVPEIKRKYTIRVGERAAVTKGEGWNKVHHYLRYCGMPNRNVFCVAESGRNSINLFYPVGTKTFLHAETIQIEVINVSALELTIVSPN